MCEYLNETILISLNCVVIDTNDTKKKCQRFEKLGVGEVCEGAITEIVFYTIFLRISAMKINIFKLKISLKIIHFRRIIKRSMENYHFWH